MATIAEAIATAVGHHEAGRLQEAEQIYGQILAIDPGNVAAWHLLGRIAQQVGDRETAIQCVERAVSYGANYAEIYSDRGTMLRDLGRLPEAIASFRRAVELKPDLTDAYFNLGMALQQQGKLDEAVASVRRAVALRPDFFQAIRWLADYFQGRGNWPEAMSFYRRALELKPDDPEAHHNLGVDHWQLQQLPEAVACYRRTLELKPDSAETWFNLGLVLQYQRRQEEAIRAYGRALELAPNYAETYNNLGNALREEGKLEDALYSLRRAVELKPDYAEAHCNLGAAWQEQGRLDEAAASFERSIALKPDHADAHWCLAALLLLQGEFERGWREYEWRWRLAEFAGRSFRQPQWDGKPAKRKTLLIHAEQGLGDTIQFVRYVPLLQERVESVILECQPALIPLLDQLPVDRLIARGKPLPKFDLHVPLLSLPGLFRTTLENIPAEVPYLKARPELVERWREKLKPLTGFRVGIAWQGKPDFKLDRTRSFRLSRFAALADVPGVCLISLQKGPGVEQLAEFRRVGLAQLLSTDVAPEESVGIAHPTIVDLGDIDEEHGAFMDTAAIMMNLDLVICSDSSVAHLAGALGVPVWVVLSFSPDWRWLLDRSDSPWYATMRLFRQKKAGDWAGAFEEIRVALSERVAAARGGKDAI